MPHFVKSYDQQLKKLRKMLYQQALLADKQVKVAFQALVNNDHSQAEKIKKKDKEINQLNQDIRTIAIEVIALRQPMAYDLRLLISAISISNDIERIGDVAKSFVKKIDAFQPENYGDNIIKRIHDMLEAASKMHLDVLECLKSKGPEEAIKIWRQDDLVDEEYKTLFQEILNKNEKSDDVNSVIKLLFVLKGIERIADHATNIAEDIYYIYKGTSLLDHIAGSK